MRASPSDRLTRWSRASSSAVAPSVSRPRWSRARTASGDRPWSRNRLERDSRGALTSKYGFSVVAPMRVSSPSSTWGRRASCWDLLKRWTSSRKRIVPWPCSPRRALARATTSRTSLTPALTADSVSKERAVTPAMRRARVVLPVPGGPQRITDVSRSASIRRRRGAPGPRRCSWPTISSRVRGRRRAARGPWRFSRSLRAAPKRSHRSPPDGSVIRRRRGPPPAAGRGRRPAPRPGSATARSRRGRSGTTRAPRSPRSGGRSCPRDR